MTVLQKSIEASAATPYNWKNHPVNHLAGWMVIISNTASKGLREQLHSGIDSFIGDYSTERKIVATKHFGFGLLVPTSPLPLTTWSYFEDAEGCCFIDGVFYDNYFSYQPTDGDDPELAKRIFDKYRYMKSKAIEELNGSFRGFIFTFNDHQLTTFIDRLGTKILYWSQEGDNLIISTNLASFSKLNKLSIDENAAFQFLTIGFPIGSRTLLKDIQIHLPGMINNYKGSFKESCRYWNIPERAQGSSLNNCVEMIMCSMEDHVERIFKRKQDKIGLALSGGHDSRVILNALVSRSIPFVPLMWRDYNFNDKIALNLCSVLNTEPIISRDLSTNELEDIQKNIFSYSDGHYLNSYGFIRLAKDSHDQGITCLMIGFSGDKISGSLTYPDPFYLKSRKELARQTLKGQMELFSFTQAQSLLKITHRNIRDNTIAEWENSFMSIDSCKYLSDISILQGFANRNLERVRFAMIPASQYVQEIFPYLDNKVLNAYFSLPIGFLKHQKAHCYAGFHRVREFGKYQASSYPLSLSQEAGSPYVLYILRLLKLKAYKLSALFSSAKYKGEWNEMHHKILDEISQSPLFDNNLLYNLYLQKNIYPAELYKLRTLARFYDFYICGNHSS